MSESIAKIFYAASLLQINNAAHPAEGIERESAIHNLLALQAYLVDKVGLKEFKEYRKAAYQAMGIINDVIRNEGLDRKEDLL